MNVKTLSHVLIYHAPQNFVRNVCGSGIGLSSDCVGKFVVLVSHHAICKISCITELKFRNVKSDE